MTLWLTIGLTFFSLLAAILPKVPSTYWIFRMYDYPLVQIFVIQLLNVYVLLSVFPDQWLAQLISFILLLNIGYLLGKILPYTPLWKKQVKTLPKGLDNPQSISLLMWNVYQYNNNYQPLLEAIEQYQPDLILLCEVNQWWVDSLQPLHNKYPHRLEKPLENTYGMTLYSKIPLEDAAISFLIEDDVPSFHATIQLPGRQKVRLHCIHPVPPAPKYSKTTEPRDAELLIVAKEVEKSNLPSLVFGDLNDVAWSDLTLLFQKTSRLLDPRRGRAILGTFHAKIPFMRVPIDQFFCSKEFQIISINRLPAMNSDHFPLFINLAYAPSLASDNDLALDPLLPDDKKIVNTKIALGLS